MNRPAGDPLRRILYVDDDEALAELCELVLSAAGLEVLVCDSGEAAVQAAARFAPDLLLLDREMPDMDGAQTLAALRAVPPCASTPVVFLTAHADQSVREGLLALGALAVLPKPFSAGSLAAELRSLYAAHVAAG